MEAGLWGAIRGRRALLSKDRFALVGGEELPSSCDLLIAGSGAAGMAAAISAFYQGLKPLIVEKAPVWGGSTAVSGGAIWIPDNPIMRQAGLADDRGAARRYLQSEAGNLFNAELVDAFLQRGPEAIDFFTTKTALLLAHRPYAPDYHSDREGAAEGGRVLDAHDYDGRRLGEMLFKMRDPIRDFTVLGGLPIGRSELYHFLRMGRSARSARYAIRRVALYARDVVLYRRNTRLVMGAAVAARLAETVFQLGVPLYLGQELVALERDGNGRVVAALVRNAGGTRRVRVHAGVALAGGGFPQDASRRAKCFEHVRRGLRHYSMSPATNTGSALDAAEAIGAAFVDRNANGGFWTPVSLLKNGDGTERPFPHLFLDRAKPGVIAVGHDGQRFTNEAASYHDFVQGLIAKLLNDGNTSAWLVCDRRALRRYGIGAVRPFPGRIRPHLRSRYLRAGRNAAELASACGIDGAGLRGTLEAFNRTAARGDDPQFRKGSTSYQRYLGDPDQRPNPCVRALEAPFYAVEIFPGDIGSTMGLDINARGMVRDTAGLPIPGLYACGNDISSIMGGAYPGAGITLGPALTFGFIVGETAASFVSEELRSR